MEPGCTAARGCRGRAARASGAGADSLSHSETIRILATEFTVTSNRPDLLARLGALAQRAEHDLPLEEHSTISVQWQDGEYRIEGGGLDAETEFSLGIALDAVFARLHKCAMRRFAGHTRLHAASGIGPDGMVLLVGGKRSGKTTLAVHLLLQGLEMLGDELVLLRDGEAITFPRRFYLRPSALDLLPDVVEASEPETADADREGRLVTIDPLQLGQCWRIRPAPVAAVVFLEPNHGGTSRITVCPKVEMVSRVLAQCSPPAVTADSGADWLADVCQTINRATTVIAHVGNLHEATDGLRRFLA